ncbi:TonB-dependent receptor [Microbulbifer salipaludis]|uniref:TonB-dependent receptor n=1 Tax=Microbulbifer salipaludis TaxID=187980 RepID=A0ABS3E7M3_9GAMM|nr:TonB-dependent receptor [Microbulbifer salipaludis]MBN8431302.1 TonB-dependent receptor [Microbulbifer salipaludis]
MTRSKNCRAGELGLRHNPLAGHIRRHIRQCRAPVLALGSVIGLSGMVALPVVAQEGAKRALEEVTVTARKRDESLQDVPVSIQALGEQRLEQQGVSGFDDYALLLPSLSYQSAGPGLSQVYMRGAADGGDGNASGSQPSVAIYLDEQPVTAIGRNLDLHIYDIARVEALAGPQGTLYGASAQSGTLRIITNKPDTQAFSAAVDVEASTTRDGDPSHVLEGYINVPLSDRAAVRLVAWDKGEGGYIDNIPGTRTYGLASESSYSPVTQVTEDNADLVEENFNELDNRGARAALKVDLNDRWTATASVLTQRQETSGTWFHDPENPNGEVGDLEVQRYFPDRSDDQFTQYGVNVEGDLGAASLVYSGSMLDRDVEYASDYTAYADYANYANAYWVPAYACYYTGGQAVEQPCSSLAIYYNDDNRYQRQTHEVRLQSQLDGPLQYVVGAFIESASHDYRQEWEMDGMAQGAGFQTMDEPNLFYLTDQKREDRQRAVFGELSYDLSEDLTVALGARFFRAESELSGISGYGTQSPWTPDAVVDSRVEDSDKTLKANVTYQVSEDIMFYATYSQGYRLGGVNRANNDLVPVQYRPDFLDNYEFGWKTELLDGALRLNGAIYRMDWEDTQFTRYDSSYGLPVGVTLNVGQSEILGIESDITYALTDNWLLSGGFAFNNAEVSEDFVVGSNFAPDGTSLPNVPELKYNLTSRHNFTVAGRDAFAQLTYAHVGESYNDLYVFKGDSPVDRRSVQDSYDNVNLRAGVDEAQWGLDVFVNNLTDERPQLTRFTAGYDSSITTARPRTLGVSFRRRF